MNKYLVWVSVALTLGACSTKPPAGTVYQAIPPANVSAHQKEILDRQLGPQPELTVIDHKYFVVYYDPEIRLPRFVKYTVTAEQIKNTHVKRKNQFRVDSLIAERDLPVVQPKEYVKSGYDQGHLAPSGDFAWDEDANAETFVMSNMAPQKPGLNRQAWRLLEEKVRSWACGEEKITVITGPILSAKPATLESGLAIPEQFFKVVIDETPPMKAIGFIYNQTDKKNVINDRVASIDEIEQKTHTNFEQDLSKEERASLHASSAPSITAWKSEKCWPSAKKGKKK